MDLKVIRTFMTITEIGSFTKAATKLGYSQSAITMQIQQLEQELGVVLFDRIGKKIFLTDKGEQLRGYGLQLLRLSEQAIEAVTAQEEVVGSLRIGMAESLSSTYLEVIVERFHIEYPKVEVVVVSEKAPKLLEQLNHNLLDLVFILDKQVSNPNWVKSVERKEAVSIVGPVDAAFYVQEIDGVESIQAYTFIMTEKGFGYRKVFDDLMNRQGVSIHTCLEIGNTEIIKDFVKKGIGLSLLPEFTIRQALISKQLKRLDVEGEPIEVWSQLIHHKGRWLSPQMDYFIKVVKETLSE